jgi:hypothetical protein
LSYNSPRIVYQGKTQIRIGVLVHSAPLIRSGFGGLDAAIATYDGLNNSIRVWSTYPNKVGEITELFGDFYVYGKKEVKRPNGSLIVRNGPLPATFIGILMNYNFHCPNGLQFRIARAIQYKSATEGGDSGAALISENGTLLGMHFFEDNLGQSYAMLADDIFNPNLFGMHITLA